LAMPSRFLSDHPPASPRRFLPSSLACPKRCFGCAAEGFKFRTKGVRCSKIGQRNPGEGAGMSEIASRLPHESQ